MRVFLDTNVLVSALLGRGLCRDLLDKALIEETVLFGAPVREEVRRILFEKLRVPDTLVKELLRKLDDMEAVPAALPSGSVEGVSDADEAPIIACAIAARSDVFVTGDKALLDLGAVAGMPIVSPRQMYERLIRTA